ncbi:MAG: DUF123 domain-containing protein [Methanomicrobiales archaeon]|nr:DUF123 domain-containing protein [Methanomicrobiales archaeon]
MNKGVYCLILRSEGARIEIGSLCDVEFWPGYYIYTGSALGPGGLVRVKRHLDLAVHRNRNPRWHLDYLLLHERFSPVGAICGSTAERLECAVATEIGGECIPGFGSSDCSCRSHLFYRSQDPASEVRRALERFGIPISSKRINTDRRS